MPRRQLRKEEGNRAVLDFQERQALLTETTHDPPRLFSSPKAAYPLPRPGWESITTAPARAGSQRPRNRRRSFVPAMWQFWKQAPSHLLQPLLRSPKAKGSTRLERTKTTQQAIPRQHAEGAQLTGVMQGPGAQILSPDPHTRKQPCWNNRPPKRCSKTPTWWRRKRKSQPGQ